MLSYNQQQNLYFMRWTAKGKIPTIFSVVDADNLLFMINFEWWILTLDNSSQTLI